MPDPNPQAAYWSHKPPPTPAQALDMTVCWRDGCQNAAAAQPDPRWRGHYCAPCQSTVLPSLVYAETAE